MAEKVQLGDVELKIPWSAWTVFLINTMKSRMSVISHYEPAVVCFKPICTVLIRSVNLLELSCCDNKLSAVRKL